MGINIQPKNDYSALFSSMNSGGNNNISDLSNLLSDYSSIKSGTYGKLLKSYYSTDDGKKSAEAVKDKNKKQTVEADETKKLYNTVSATAGALQKSVDDIKALKSDATDEEVYNAVNSYVKNYNSLIDAGAKTGNDGITGKLNTITGNTVANGKKLGSIGITIDENGKLSLDKEKLAKADNSAVKSLFADRASYGYSVSVTAGMAASSASYEASKTSIYTNSGSYNVSTGTMMDSLF